MFSSKLWYSLFTAAIISLSITGCKVNPNITNEQDRILHKSLQKIIKKHDMNLKFKHAPKQNQLPRHEELIKLHKRKFVDTEKPNAVIVFPTYDYNHAFKESTTMEFVRGIDRYYDVNFKFCSNIKDAIKVFTQTPEISFGCLTGHGNYTSLRLGKGKNKKITIDDNLIPIFENFSKDGTLFLYSCLTQMGGVEAQNLANTIRIQSGGLRIIAFRASRNIEFGEIKSFMPFTLVDQNSYMMETYNISEIITTQGFITEKEQEVHSILPYFDNKAPKIIGYHRRRYQHAPEDEFSEAEKIGMIKDLFTSWGKKNTHIYHSITDLVQQ